MDKDIQNTPTVKEVTTKPASDGTKMQQIKTFNTDKATVAKLDTKTTEEKDNKEVIKEAGIDKKAIQAQKRLEDEQRDKELEQREKTKNDVLDAVNIAGERAKQASKPTFDFISALPTPGGIATILGVIIFFVLAVLPVDNEGNTRLKLLWLTITGKTHLSYSGTDTPSLVTIGTSAPPKSSGNRGKTTLLDNSHGPLEDSLAINIADTMKTGTNIINFSTQDTLGLPAFTLLFGDE